MWGGDWCEKVQKKKRKLCWQSKILTCKAFFFKHDSWDFRIKLFSSWILTMKMIYEKYTKQRKEILWNTVIFIHFFQCLGYKAVAHQTNVFQQDRSNVGKKYEEYSMRVWSKWCLSIRQLKKAFIFFRSWKSMTGFEIFSPVAPEQFDKLLEKFSPPLIFCSHPHSSLVRLQRCNLYHLQISDRFLYLNRLIGKSLR